MTIISWDVVRINNLVRLRPGVNRRCGGLGSDK